MAKGDLLLELEDTDYGLNLQQAEANLSSSSAQQVQADARLKRARELGQNQYLSADDLLTRETEVMVIAAQIRANEVSIAIARRNLQKCRILAPFNAVVDDRIAQVGAFVGNGSPLLSLTELDHFELDSEIAARVADSIEIAQSIRFVSGDHTYPVKLLRLSPVIDVERRIRRARFGFPENFPAVGSSGEVIWQVDSGMLPASLMVRRSGQLGIFTVDQNTARFVALANAQEGRPVTVTLPLDTTVVVQGRDRLQDGDAVNTGHE